jgi:hypothetical protein
VIVNLRVVVTHRALALIALVAVAILATATLSGNFRLLGQQTYSTAKVGGRIIGKAFTAGNAIGTVTTIFFRPANNSTAKGLPASIDADGTYSITLTNGKNYTVHMYVVDPNNDEDTGICQGQTVFLNNLHQASYSFDITPVNCA